MVNTAYALRFLQSAKKEWEKLDSTIKRQFQKKLAERLNEPRIENAFLHLKRWRGAATRYAKTLASFAAAVQARCIALWLNVLA